MSLRFTSLLLLFNCFCERQWTSPVFFSLDSLNFGISAISCQIFWQRKQEWGIQKKVRCHGSYPAPLSDIPTLHCTSSVYCAILSLLVPKYFLLPFPNCAYPQGSAFCSSPTMQFSHSQFYHWAYSSIYPAFNFPQGLSQWPVDIHIGSSTFNALCLIPNLAPSLQSRHSFHFSASANVSTDILRITNVKSFCLHYQRTLHNRLSWNHINILLTVPSLPFL